MNPEAVCALVLAAGFSTRMGDFKPLLMLGGMTILERVIRLFHCVGVGRIHVVVGHRAAELTPLIDRWGARSILNERYTEGMFSSVAAGVRSLDDRTECFFVLPVDVPLVRPATLRSLMKSFRTGTAAICHPTFQGQRGHPPLITIRFRAAIADWRGDGGLKTLLQRFEAETAEVSVPDECILHDMDRPDDHRRMCARLATRHILSPTECQSLLTERLNVSPAVKAHGRAVAEMAVRIGEALNRAGSSLDLELIRAAALVHDMARGKPGHARRAAQLLRELDVPAMAEIVESHMDLTVRDNELIREAEVVFLADKLIRGERFVGLEARYLARLEELSADPLAQAAVRSKLESARRSAARVESVIGRSVASLTCDTGANSPADELRNIEPLSSPPRSPEIEEHP